MTLSKAFQPFAVIQDLKRTIASIREQWRSSRRENERLREETAQWRERAERLEREREQLREENERLKGQLEDVQRAAKAGGAVCPRRAEATPAASGPQAWRCLREAAPQTDPGPCR